MVFTMTDQKSVTGITTKQAEALQGAFNYFNKALFKDSLPQCMITLNRSRNAYGYFVPAELWLDAKGEKYNEIALNPDYMQAEDEKRTDKDVFGTLVHEMCHLWQHYDGSEPRRCYHNKDFAAKMEAVGLQTTSDGTPTGKRTGQSMTHIIIEGGPFDKAFTGMPKELLLPLHTLFAMDNKKKRPTKKRKKSTIKYVCPMCGAEVTGKRGLNLMCTECQQLLRPVDDNE